MIEIKFYLDSDFKDFSVAVKDYEEIWGEYGERIVESWERNTGLKFRESCINAVVFDGISRSHPLSLRHDYDSKDKKKSVLTHELGHRILYKRVDGGDRKSSLQSHKLLFLVFYDVLKELYGEEFTNNSIAWESTLGPDYKGAWDWVLGFNEEERKAKFVEVLEGSYSLI